MSDIDNLMREKLAELIAKRDAIFAEAQPLRDERHALKASIAERVDVLEKQLDVVERDLFDLCNEIGRVAKALGGKAMSDVA